MMQAIISGHLGRFAIPSGTGHLVFDMGETVGRQVETAQLGYAFRFGNDVESVEVRSVSEASAVAQTAHDTDVAIRLFILLLEADDTDEERREVAADLNELMRLTPVREEMANRFFSHPFLETFDVERAQRAATGLQHVETLLVDLVDCQPAITVVRKAFDAIPLNLFASRKEQKAALERAIDKGVFVSLSRGIRTGNAGMAVLSAYQALRSLPNHREIVGNWTEDFRQPHMVVPKHRPVEDKEEVAEVGALYGAAARRAFENAIEQQATITGKLRSGDIVMARRYAADLVATQRTNSTTQDIAKSLCRLSKEAQRVAIFTLQYEWALQATEICPEDAMTHGHLADALMALHRFAESSAVLERVSTAAPSFYATGRARILRAQGRLVEAETAYRSAIERYSDYDDIFHAYAGLGGTLRELGRLDESLTVYDNALADFPDEEILHVGKGATLVELGRLAEARQSYSRAAGTSSFDRLVALNGQATISKLIGDFVKAERDYGRIITAYEHDSFAQLGLADLRRLQGQHAEAVKLYRKAIVRFPFTPQPHLGLAETLREMNRLADAQQVLRSGMREFPDDARLAIAHAATLRRAGERMAALEAINVVVADYPRSIPAALERAHALKALGYDDQALEAFEAVLSAAPHNLHASVAKASLLAIQDRFSEAMAAIQHISPETQVGWRAENLRALISLRSGDVKAARSTAEHALKDVQFDRERRIIRSTLASILLKEHAPKAAVAVLATPDRMDDEITRIVRLHAAAFLERTAATRAYREAKDVTGELGIVREQIGVQLGLVKHLPAQPKGWLENSLQLAILREAA